MAPNNRNTLKKYHTLLTRKRFPVTCSYSQCGNSIIVNQFERHCTVHHSLNSKLCCVWCEGAVSWQEGCKSRHADHLLTCMNHFITEHRLTTPSSAPDTPSPTFSGSPKLMNLRVLSAAETFFDFTDGDMSTLEHALEHVQLLVTQPPLLPTSDRSLNVALSYMTSYLETRDTHDWMHVMIKMVAYPSFVRALIQDQGQTRTLRFSCWCNGGKYGAERYRQHRHLILTAPRGHFRRCFWGKVMLEDPEDKPCSNFPCKRVKEIQSPLHFVNTLGYLSHRKSRCKFSFREEEQEDGSIHNHHFYLFESLPVDYRRVLVGCWEGGLSQLLFMERFQRVSVPRLIERPIVFQHGQWKQKIQDFYNLPRGQVLPVEKRFMPTTQATPYTYHLLQGRKLYFTSDPEHEALSQEEWLRKQAEGGNCFYETVGENFWTPRPRYQEKLNEMMPLVQQIQKLNRKLVGYQSLKKEIHCLKRKYEVMEEQNRTHIRKLEEENRTQIQKLNEEIQILKEERNQRSPKVIEITLRN